MADFETYTLRITQDIIDRSTPGDACDCALVNAMREAIPGVANARVNGELSFFTDDDFFGHCSFADCPEAEKFVLAFDDGRARPCEIEATFTIVEVV